MPSVWSRNEATDSPWSVKRPVMFTSSQCVNTLRPRQNGCQSPDDVSQCNFLNENVWIPIKISLKFVPKGPINNITALVQIMAWRRPGDKSLSEPMMVSLLTHICVTRPQGVLRRRFFFQDDHHLQHLIITRPPDVQARLSFIGNITPTKKLEKYSSF